MRSRMRGELGDALPGARPEHLAVVVAGIVGLPADLILRLRLRLLHPSALRHARQL